ncbi:MAG: TRAP transporter fused permease subunit [Acidobacteriota bacterium]|nr:TRAP transporter fused permease subunit [Acidobacteriota bacterium]
MEAWRRHLNYVLGGLLCLFVVSEVNYPFLAPQSQLAVFAMLGMVLAFLNYPLDKRLAGVRALRVVDVGLAVVAVACCLYVFVQTEPVFESWWAGGQSLGNRAGQETALDLVVGVVGLILVIEATRRAIGWALPVLALVFLLYAKLGSFLPGWLFPHRGYTVERIVSQTFLHSQGVFGTALRVMFVYVFLFVLFGAVLRQTGATQFIVDFARRILGRSPGGAAKVSVVSSGMMGSLSGSAVANTATTGTFTIPMMRSAGFRAEIAGGVEAAASSGGALVPPVMGAGAYMMLEIIDPPVTYVQIIKAAIIPAVLYYLSLFLIVHFYARRIGSGEPAGEDRPRLHAMEGVVFVAGIATLVVLLLQGYSVFRAATVALLAVVVVGAFHGRTRLTWSKVRDALAQSARDAVPLIVAASSVGVIIGVVTLTGIGTKLPSSILDLSQNNLFLALVLIMVSSIILGMGLPSAVCYLLMATLIGSALADLGVVALAAHLFIFYFGLMSMVTPPVALAAYTAASISGSGIMQTGFAAFRFALVGFTLPYMFVYRPELLMLSATGEPAGAGGVALATILAILGIVPFAAGIAGYLIRPLSVPLRIAALASSALLLAATAAPPGPSCWPQRVCCY